MSEGQRKTTELSYEPVKAVYQQVVIQKSVSEDRKCEFYRKYVFVFQFNSLWNKRVRLYLHDVETLVLV